MSEDNVKDMSTTDDAGGSGQQVEAVMRVPMEIYSRVVGYLRPVSAWNAAKQQEFKERTVFKQPEPAPECE